MATNPHQSELIESKKDFKEQTPRHTLASYWRAEIAGSERMLREWRRKSDRIVQRYLDYRRGDANVLEDRKRRMRLNLFHSNVSTQQDLLYDHVPQVEVSRRSKDSDDDQARLAAVIMERLLNNDTSRHEQATNDTFRAVLEDRLLPGLGVAAIEYQAPRDDDPATEAAPIVYRHWRDVLYSWSRTFSGLRWQAFRSYVEKDKALDRYGSIAHDFDYKVQSMVNAEHSDAADVPENNDNWKKAEIWKIWDKESRTVVEYSPDVDRLPLAPIPDPLGLDDFFPTPSFLIANPTTSLYIPTPDFHLAQDLYNEVDKLQTRIGIITEAVKVVGVRDASQAELDRLLKEGTDNALIPVDNWAMLAEKGGLQGVIDWFPIKEVVDALLNLRSLRDETIQLLYQVTGVSDIMRGQLDNQYEGVQQSEQKVQFASVRMQSLQSKLASFVAHAYQIKAEVIARHFSPAAIIEQSNAYELPDAKLEGGLERIAAAVALIKDPQKAQLRCKVQADSMALQDFAKVQSERLEVAQVLSTMMRDSAPLIEQQPQMGPYILRFVQWVIAGSRGADEIEGVLDQAVDASMQAQQQPQQNQDAEKEQAKAQGQIQLVQAKAQAEMQTRQHDAQLDVQLEQAKARLEMQKTEAEFRQQAALIELKANADMQVETHQSRTNAEQQALGVEAELNKDIVQSRVDLEAETEKTALEIRKIAAQESERRETNRQSKTETDSE